MTTPTYNDPFGLLRNKKAAELAAGAFTALEGIPPTQRSRYAPNSEEATIELDLGYVQAGRIQEAVRLGHVRYASAGDHRQKRGFERQQQHLGDTRPQRRHHLFNTFESRPEVR